MDSSGWAAATSDQLGFGAGQDPVNFVTACEGELDGGRGGFVLEVLVFFLGEIAF